MGILEDIFGPHEVVGTGPPAPTPPPPLDTDGDGIPDEVENYQLGTDARDADTDHDGLSDPDEVNRGTDPRDKDTDDDGLTDFQEAQQFGTDPLHWDTDRDGLSDGQESNYRADALDPDSDNDGVLDGREVKVRTDPTDADTDNDGLADGQEINVLGTNAKKADTDGDGRTDQQEYQDGTDPTQNEFVDITSRVIDANSVDDGDDDPFREQLENQNRIGGAEEDAFHLERLVTDKAVGFDAAAPPLVIDPVTALEADQRDFQQVLDGRDAADAFGQDDLRDAADAFGQGSQAGAAPDDPYELEPNVGAGVYDDLIADDIAVTAPAAFTEAPAADFGAGAGGEEAGIIIVGGTPADDLPGELLEPDLPPATPPGVPIPYPNADVAVPDPADPAADVLLDPMEASPQLATEADLVEEPEGAAFDDFDDAALQ